MSVGGGPGLPLAVVGAGLVGQRHARLAAASGAVRLTAVVETDAARRAALAAEGLPVVAGLDAVPAGTRAAIVATPTPDHAATGLACLGRGWAVLVEKPVAATLAEADALIAAARTAGLALVAGHHRRCHPFVAEARARLRLIGRPVALSGIWSLRKHAAYFDVPWRRVPGAGPVMTNLSHELDLLRVLAGEIEAVSCLASTAARGLAVEDSAAIALRFRSGALGSVAISDAGASPWAFEAATGENPDIPASGEDCLRISGTEGALAFPSLTLWRADGEAEWRRPLRREPVPARPPLDPLAEQLSRFARIAGGRSDPASEGLASGADGRATLAATLATLLSAARGRPVATDAVPEGYRGPVPTAEGTHA